MLGIEAVEWFSEGGETLTVRVTGRWRRRRPAWSGQPMLVLEAQGRRHRFPAMPEPPSLTGAGPGTWRISFSVPVALAPDLGGRTWLQFGSVVVALPAAVQPLAAGEGEIDVAGADPSSQLDAVDEGVHPASSELETESARRRAKGAEAVAAELAKRVHTLESALAAARRQADELSTALTERELGRRAAEQRAHAEQALRRDLTRKLSARSEEGARARQALGDLAAAEQRIRELEAELADARRRGDEAEQFAAAAAVARERAEHHATDAEHRATDAEHRATDAEHRAGHAEHRATDAEHRATDAEHRVTDAEHHAADAEHRATDAQNSAARAERERTAPSAVSGPGSAELVRLRFERGLIGRRVNAEPRVPSEPWPPVAHATLEHEVGAEARPSSAATPSSSSAEVPMPVPPSYVAAAEPITDSSRALIATLRRELDVRAGAEATLLARIVEAESKLGTRVLLERRTAAILVELRRELDGLRAAWEAERAGRAAAEERADELAGEAAAGRRRSRQAHEAIVELRRALRELQAAAADESSPPAPEDPPPSVAEEQPPAPAPDQPYPAPDQPYPAPDPPHPAPDPPSRSAPDQPPSAAAEAPAPAAADEPAPAQVVEPERFNVARVRLREAIAPHEPGPEPAPAAAPSEGTTVTPWLEPIFRGVARTDPDAAGRMLLALLPAQRVAFAEPVAYDLVLGGHRGCARVTVRDGAPVIRYADGPRPGGEVDFQVLGDPAAVARLLTAGPLRRLMRRGVARVRGRRDRLGALRGLVGVRLDFPGLYRAGVRLEPELALMIVARMIEPAWTARERFTVAYAAEAGTVYLLVRDGRPVQVTDEPPGGRIATTITGPAEALALVLSGERGEPVTVTGEDWPLALLRKWIKRAQSD